MCDGARGLYGFTAERIGKNGDWSNEALLLGIEDNHLSIAGTLKLGWDAPLYGSRLCFIGDTLYLVYGMGVVAYDYTDLVKLGSIRF